MKTFNNLEKEQKNLFGEIYSQATSLLRDVVKGYEYVRIYAYPSLIEEYKKTENSNIELVGAHFFTGSNSDDIDQSDQIEIFSFQQEPDLEEDWFDCELGENWLRQAENEISEKIMNYFFN